MSRIELKKPEMSAFLVNQKDDYYELAKKVEKLIELGFVKEIVVISQERGRNAEGSSSVALAFNKSPEQIRQLFVVSFNSGIEWFEFPYQQYQQQKLAVRVIKQETFDKVFELYLKIQQNNDKGQDI
jgi:hypothetical protein